MSHPESDYFLRWFNFNWKPEEEETLAELFLAETGSKLDRDLHRFIEATVRAPYSFFQTLEVEPGKELTLRDVVRRFEVRVKEKSASTILQRGQILFARVVEMDGILFLMGNGSHSIPPLFLGHMLALRTTLEGTRPPAVKGSIPPELLRDREGELREVYFRIVDEAENPKLEVQNTDGDRLELHTLSYEIPSLDVAFRALKDLEANVTGKTDDELLTEAERDEAGKPTRVWLYWLRRGKKGSGEGNTALGTLTISASTLVVEVNSEKRSKRIQREITKRLGKEAVLLRTEIRSQEDLKKEAAKSKDDSKSARESEHDRLMRESPEARDLMKGIMERHWATWPDKSLPALRGMTPRRAAKDPEGRELLESLLMDIELRNRTQKDEFLRVDTVMLRRELGMDADPQRKSR